MKIKTNECFPEVTFYQLLDGGPKKVKSSVIFNKKKVILVGVPGAFTPTCSNDHLPGYLNNHHKFIEKGIDEIFFVSNNDPFVMDAWIKSYKDNEIKILSDCNYELLEAIGLQIDLSVIGLGKRLSRFAIIIDNGLIKEVFNENGGELNLSKAENLLGVM